MNKFIFRLLLTFTILIICIASVVIGAFIGVYHSLEQEIPDISIVTYQPPLNSMIYDCKGRVITELHNGGENRSEKARLTDIPVYLSNAVIAIEDERFWKHHGIDPYANLRAIWVDIMKKTAAQGASTISQQLARNAFLTAEKTIERKIKEAIVALKIEKLFSKEEILENYLNQIYFGPQAYGIVSAARTYFNKTPSQLTLLESAVLAGLIRNPSYYSPYKNPSRTLQRAKLVLSKMLEQKLITWMDYENALKQPLQLNFEKKFLPPAPYFVFEYLMPLLTKSFDEKKILTGGWKIYTTLDLDIQQSADEAFRNAEIFKELHDLPDNRIDGCLICLETSTSKIRAMVGGKSYLESKFNRTVIARRQMGSAFKPFIYLAAMNARIPPNKIVDDEPHSYPVPGTNQIWSPHNYQEKYHGPTTLIDAIVGSYNMATIELLRLVGCQPVIDIARKLGLTSKLEARLSMALGSYEAIPLEIAECYASIARMGISSPSIGIERVEDKDGNILLENNFKGLQSVSPQACYVIVDLMKKVNEFGTGTTARLDNHVSAGKTGTTDNYTNAWYCGITPEFTFVTYIGFDTPIPMGGNRSGGHVAAPIFKDFMEKALKNYPPSNFPRPDGVVDVMICRNSGLLATESCPRKITQAFLAGTEPDSECSEHGEGASTVEENDEEAPTEDSPDFDEYDQLKKGTGTETGISQDTTTSNSAGEIPSGVQDDGSQNEDQDNGGF
ncbi:MAG: PBP1A family penicillin-binding protein [Candidatus Wallbacteria bacterium]|nr:PBP1A family penicillin-binding protein [Candidatus Wallbacteria bacterium]